jgi:hypothetical protein
MASKAEGDLIIFPSLMMRKDGSKRVSLGLHPRRNVVKYLLEPSRPAPATYTASPFVHTTRYKHIMKQGVIAQTGNVGAIASTTAFW